MTSLSELAKKLQHSEAELQQAIRELGIVLKKTAPSITPQDLNRLIAHLSPPIERSVRIKSVVGPVRGECAAKLRLHEDLLLWFTSPETDPRFKRRANLVLRQLMAFGRTSIVKSVRGAGQGWRRSPLGGNHGMHFYLWWVPTGAPPISGVTAPTDTIFLRAVRHHDETEYALPPGDLVHDYLDLEPEALVNQQDEYSFAFNDTQRRAATSTGAVRFIKGHPGSGKTTTLWLAASSIAESRRALYLTCTPRLASDANQYFRALGPQSLAVEAMTFRALCIQLSQSQTAPLTEEEAAEEFSRVVQGRFRSDLGVWEGCIDELYAELHAHAVGRALPVSLRGLPASEGMCMSTDNYLALRTSQLGAQGAQIAAQIVAQLEAMQLIERLFPGPTRARRALDRLRQQPALERFAKLDCIFLDEAQDLTTVELSLLVDLCAAIGVRSGVNPVLIVAGDEGQTVRPSDFEWGRLADLTANQIGKRTEFELPGNVRSPQNIAKVINQSWDMYRQLSKEERPRGYAVAQVDEASYGRVIYTTCEDQDELRRVVDTFDKLPNAALVYPGYHTPRELQVLSTSEAIFTSRSAKGLDFQTVGVLDAGRQMARLRGLSQSAEKQSNISALWGRVLADHLRVALSRSTENLILLDTSPERHMKAEVQALLGKTHWMEMSTEELVSFLQQDEQDASSMIYALCDEVEKLLGNHSARAYHKIKQATTLLGDLSSKMAVSDASLRRQAFTLRGVVAIDLLQHHLGSHSMQELLTDARLSFEQAAREEDEKAMRLVEKFYASGTAPQSIAGDIKKLLPLLPTLERRVGALIRSVLVSWCEKTSAIRAPSGKTAQSLLVEVVQQITTVFGEESPALADYRERLLSLVALSSKEEGRFQDALDFLAQLSTRQHAEEAFCYEKLAKYESAAKSYELSGDPTLALQNFRRAPEVSHALRLARSLKHEDTALLQWLEQIQQQLASLEATDAARLTTEERQALTRLLESKVQPQQTTKGKSKKE
jgi:tetratricopeptide (TPR) repeat protein